VLQGQKVDSCGEQEQEAGTVDAKLELRLLIDLPGRQNEAATGPKKSKGSKLDGAELVPKREITECKQGKSMVGKGKITGAGRK